MPQISRGPAVLNGVVQYTSPSALQLADPDDYYGCPRRYWWRYVQRKSEPKAPWQDKGIELIHKPIEAYLKTGDGAHLNSTVTVGKQFIPKPGADLKVEFPIDGVLRLHNGLPLVGAIDCMHKRASHISSAGEPITTPTAYPEVIDWKGTGDLAKAKTGQDLRTTIQMTAYGRYAMKTEAAERVRLSHVYFTTTGRPEAKKSTTVVDNAQLLPTWQKIEKLGALIVDIGKQTSETQVEAVTRNCKRCPHRGYCAAGQPTLFSLANIKLGADMNPIEQLLKQNAAPLPPPTSQQKLVVSPEFVGAILTLEGFGHGMPALNGEAAELYAAHKGFEFKGAGYAGSGTLGMLNPANTAADVIKYANDCKMVPAEQAAPQPEPMPQILPPDAPESKPELASALPTVVEPPKKRGRKPKAESVTPPFVPSEERDPPGTSDGAMQNMKLPEGFKPGISLFVDCITTVQHKTLEFYVDSVCAEICKQYGALDLRCAPTDGPLGFGRWKGALAATVRENLPTPGIYTIDTRGNEVMEVVADALRGKCDLYVRGIR